MTGQRFLHPADFNGAFGTDGSSFHDGDKFSRVGNFLAVHFEDNVLNLQSGFIGGRVLGDLCDENAAGSREFQCFGDSGIDILRQDTDVSAAHFSIFGELVTDPLCE